VCFAHYRRHFWREDRATHIAQHLGKGADAAPMTGLHFKAGDIHVPSWRTEIYDRAQLADRLTFLYSPVPHSAYSINLYRDLAHGAFQTAEIERLLAVAPLLKQAHRGALRSGGAPGEALALRVQRAEDGLRRRVPELSPRERAVCARIACGISADGIAAELDVAPSTVITLRKRAYAKLNARGLPAGRMQLADAARRLS
jgi:DNA-binding CsgD family transcriptional regulator